MAKINILPSKVYNRIAAGEVVDRPCSVVKELIENAVDAGATEIEIHIERGGKELIRVVDNGCGIERDDLQSAFLPHATSKIAQADDLNNILTLGFRGEAIASISSVSQMTITSKTEEGKRYSLSCNGGEMGRIKEVGGEERGTDVRVEMLFYHTPVRLGFLKTDKAEELEITNFIARFILNRSDIAFSYYANGRKVMQSFGGGDEEAMVSVYGAATLSECFHIDAEKHGIRIRGYIGGQNFFKANKSYQSVFLNGRYIVNTTVSAALSNAYSSYLMKRQYPFYVLHIDVPTEIVDVNVHPNKSDVRFADNQIIYGCIYSVISAVLDGQAKGVEYILKTPTKEIFTDESLTPVASRRMDATQLEENVQTPQRMRTSDAPAFSYADAQRELERSAPAFTAKKKGMELPFTIKTVEEADAENPPLKLPKGVIPVGQIGPPLHHYAIPKPTLVEIPKGPYPAEALLSRFPNATFVPPEMIVTDAREEKIGKETVSDAVKTPQTTEEDVFAENKRYLEEVDAKIKQNRLDIHACLYVGKLFNTYLMYEYKDCVYIIDQHAAHERIVFNRLKEQMRNRTVVRQPMLMPYEIPLNAFESAFIREQMDNIREMGFTIEEESEGLFAISEVPLDMCQIDLNCFIHDILSEINNYRAIKLEELLKDKLASAACKAAIKGGMDITRKEIETLLVLMDGDMTLKCPHGRPVVVKMTKKAIEKTFKRIV